MGYLPLHYILLEQNSFNSLYGIHIQDEEIIDELAVLSIPFMGYFYLVLIVFHTFQLFQFPLWDTGRIRNNETIEEAAISFQFPLWDTSHIYLIKPDLTVDFQFPLWDTC